VPHIGTTTQRGDRETARRTAAIASPSPPSLTKRRADGPTPPAKRSVINIINIEGPKSALPTEVSANSIDAATRPPEAVVTVPVDVRTDARPPDTAAAGKWRPPRAVEGEPPTGPPSGLFCPPGARSTSHSTPCTRAGQPHLLPFAAWPDSELSTEEIPCEIAGINRAPTERHSGLDSGCSQSFWPNRVFSVSCAKRSRFPVFDRVFSASWFWPGVLGFLRRVSSAS